MSSNVPIIVAVDWKASLLVGVNSGVSWALGWSIGVARGGVLDDGREKLGIREGGGLDDAQLVISKARIAHIVLCM